MLFLSQFPVPITTLNFMLSIHCVLTSVSISYSLLSGLTCTYLPCSRLEDLPAPFPSICQHPLIFYMGPCSQPHYVFVLHCIRQCNFRLDYVIVGLLVCMSVGMGGFFKNGALPQFKWSHVFDTECSYLLSSILYFI